MLKVWLKDKFEPTQEDLEWIVGNYDEDEFDEWCEDCYVQEDIDYARRCEKDLFLTN